MLRKIEQHSRRHQMEDSTCSLPFMFWCHDKKWSREKLSADGYVFDKKPDTHLCVSFKLKYSKHCKTKILFTLSRLICVSLETNRDGKTVQKIREKRLY